MSSYLRWWSAHTNTNTALPPPPRQTRPLIGQSAASWALIGWAAATLWSSIIGRREEKLSTLTWKTVNNICYFWNQLIASIQSVIDNAMEQDPYSYDMIEKIFPNRIWVHYSIRCPNSLLGLCKGWSNWKKNCPLLQTNTDCIDKDWAFQIEINWLQQTRNEHLKIFINICLACKIFIFSASPHMNC